VEAPKKSPPSLAKLGVIKARRTTSQSSKMSKPSSYSSQFAPQTKSFEKSNTPKQVSFLGKDDDTTASEDDDDDDDDLDAKPKAPKPWPQRPAPEPMALPRTSIFALAKQKSNLPPKFDGRSSTGIPPKLTSAAQSSAFNQNFKVDETTESIPDPPSSPPSAAATATKTVEDVPSLAEIKRRIAERRRRYS